jgi:uncharacterized protein (DUF58 family)
VTVQALRREAEGEAARLPALLAEARRLAATVQTGAHARRREGAGEAFWSYRPYRLGDEPRRIDWRRSARGDEVLIREQEEARAATVWLWPDRRPGMRWRSRPELPLKSERAVVLALALASLLGRGGERCGLLGGGARPTTGLQATERLAQALTVGEEDETLPAPAPDRTVQVLISDGLDHLPISDGEVARSAGGVASTGAEAAASTLPSPVATTPPALRASSPSATGGRTDRGVLLRIADPAEIDFPFAGRVVFEAPGGGASRRFGRAQAVGDDYRAARAARLADVDAAAARAGLRVLEHRTDQPAALALLALWRALAGAG